MLHVSRLAIRVESKKAGEVIEFVERLGVRDKRRRVVSSGAYVEVPVVECENLKELLREANFDFELVKQEKPVYARPRTLEDALRSRIPENLMKKLPKTYKVLGDIILVKIPEELEDYAGDIGKSLLEVNPHCKSVWWDRGKRGMLRKPDIVLIAGEGGETTHREGGCIYKFDVSKVMFSPGNQAERIRMGRIVKKGEIVVDMFAGIGYFTIPMAKKAKVYAIEINPDSYHYLLENIRLNEVESVIPVLGDSMYVTPERIADRVVMGHVSCHEFLPVAIRALREGGWIHYHESVPEQIIERPVRRVISAARAEGKEVRIENVRKVKNYSPGVVHVVVDAYVF